MITKALQELRVEATAEEIQDSRVEKIIEMKEEVTIEVKVVRTADLTEETMTTSLVHSR